MKCVKRLTADQQRLAEENLSIVERVLRFDINVNPCVAGLGYEDLYQEGCVWLCNAALTFDPARGSFASYARQVVQNGLVSYCRNLTGKQSRMISLAEMEPTALAALEVQHSAPFDIECETPLLLAAAESQYSGVTRKGVHALALDSVGTKLYSELSSDGMGRNQALRNLQTTLDGVDAAMDGVLVEGANVYAATEASALIRTPFRSSGYDLEDFSVPFYQMVFHGYVNYTLDATNLASDPATRTLNCIEFGASPLFSLVGRNQDELIGSRLDALYSADASAWLDFAAEQYSQINAALRSVQNSTMTDYQVLSNPVRVVTYDNGTEIYVNYGEATTVNGIRLEAKGFAVVENGRLTLSEAAIGEQ